VLDSIPVTVEVTANKSIDHLVKLYVKQKLGYNEEATVYATSVNTYHNPDDYQLDAYTNFKWDANLMNDTTNNHFIVYPPKAIPYAYTFETSNYYMAHGQTAEYETPDFVGTIGKNDYLAIDYFVQASDNNNMYDLGNYLRNDDKIEIWVAEDCNRNYTKFLTIDATNHHNQSTYAYVGESLAAYDGKTLAFKVRFVKGNVGYTHFFLNDLVVRPNDGANIVSLNIGDNSHRTCGFQSDTATLVFINNGFKTLVNPKYGVDMYTPDKKVVSVTGNYVGTVANGQSVEVKVGAFTSNVSGEYSFRAYVVNPYADAENDTLIVDYENIPLQSLTYVEDFDNPISNWYSKSNNTNNNWFYSDYKDVSNIATPQLKENDTLILISPKMGEVKSTTRLNFVYLIETYDLSNSKLGNYLRNGDVIDVSVSNNCGVSYKSVFKLNGTMANDVADVYREQNVSLAEFAGTDILVKFTLIKGQVGTYNFYLDRFAVINGETPLADVGVSDVFTNSYSQDRLTNCSTRTDSVSVTISNYYTYKVSKVPVTIEIFNGTTTTKVSKMYNDTIQPNTSVSMPIAKINTLSEGFNEMKAYTGLESDINHSNDTTGFIVSNRPYHVPYYALLRSSAVDYQSWMIHYPATFLGNGFATYNFTRNDTAIVVSPKVGKITSESYLIFDYKMYNSLDGGVTKRLRNYDETFMIQVSTDCGEHFAQEFKLQTQDNDTALNGTVKISLAKYAGQEILTRFVITKGQSNGLMSAEFTNIHYTNNPVLRPGTPSTVDTLVSNKYTTTFTTIPVASNNNGVYYIWRIEPKEAGTIIENDNTVDAVWNPDYYGVVQVSVKAALMSTFYTYAENSNLFIYQDEFGNYFSEWSKPRAVVLDACLAVDNKRITEFAVYPNPASDKVNVKVPNNTGTISIHIINTQGVVVYSTQTSADATTIDVSGLAKGVYILEVSTDKTKNQKQLIIF
jgi:hypothetical protein